MLASRLGNLEDSPFQRLGLGTQAHLEIVDEHTGGWGHTQVDHIEFSDARRTEDGPALPPDLALNTPATTTRLAVAVMLLKL